MCRDSRLPKETYRLRLSIFAGIGTYDEEIGHLARCWRLFPDKIPLRSHGMSEGVSLDLQRSRGAERAAGHLVGE